MKNNVEFSELSNRVIGCAIEVHKELGPGLLESAYQECLCHELSLNNISFEREKSLPIVYKGISLDCGYRLDIVIENEVIIELKSIEQLKSIHEAQMISYLKLSGIRQGLLINFNVELLKNGLKSFVV